MRRVVVGVLALLSACAPAAPTLTAEEAETIVNAVGRGASTVDICSAEGRSSFRAAVSAYSRAQAAEGVVWPDFFGALDGDREMGSGELAVMGAIIAGYVRSSDLAGEARDSARMINLSMSFGDQNRVFRDGMQDACPEVVRLQQLMAREQVEAQRVERRAQRMEERGDRERAYDVRQRYFNRAQRVRTEMQQLTQTIEEKISAGGDAN
jgi:hypothetical protein